MNHANIDDCRFIADNYCKQPDGKMKQTYQAVQELSELICVLTRREDQKDGTFKESVVDEIADCEIMLEQIKHIYQISDAEIALRVNQKITRQLTRIQAEDHTTEKHENLQLRNCADCKNSNFCEEPNPCDKYEYAGKIKDNSCRDLSETEAYSFCGAYFVCSKCNFELYACKPYMNLRYCPGCGRFIVED